MRVTRRRTAAGAVGASLVVAAGVAIAAAAAVAIVASRGDDPDPPPDYRCNPTEQLGLTQRFTGGDIDGDGHVDVVRTWRLETSGCTAAPAQDCGLGPYDSWMLDAELSASGHKRIVLPISTLHDARLGQVWGVADAAGDGRAEIFVGLDAATADTTPETSGDHSDSREPHEETPSGFVLDTLYLGVVTLAEDELVVVAPDPEVSAEECLLLSYTLFGGHHPAEGFACRDVTPDDGRELVTMTAAPPYDAAVLEGSQTVYRWRGTTVERIETRQMTGSFDDFRRIDCQGVGSPPLSNVPP